MIVREQMIMMVLMLDQMIMRVEMIASVMVYWMGI